MISSEAVGVGMSPPWLKWMSRLNACFYSRASRLSVIRNTRGGGLARGVRGVERGAPGFALAWTADGGSEGTRWVFSSGLQCGKGLAENARKWQIRRPREHGASFESCPVLYIRNGLGRIGNGRAG